jgi:hypothetical protein
MTPGLCKHTCRMPSFSDSFACPLVAGARVGAGLATPGSCRRTGRGHGGVWFPRARSSRAQGPRVFGPARRSRAVPAL